MTQHNLQYIKVRLFELIKKSNFILSYCYDFNVNILHIMTIIIYHSYLVKHIPSLELFYFLFSKCEIYDTLLRHKRN